MPATTIHFVRHGEVDNPNHVLYERLSGFHLSARGYRRRQRRADVSLLGSCGYCADRGRSRIY